MEKYLWDVWSEEGKKNVVTNEPKPEEAKEVCERNGIDYHFIGLVDRVLA